MPRLLAPALAIVLAILGVAPGRAAADEVIPFEVRYHLIIVDVSINGSQPTSFVFDTGATETMVLPSLARELNLAGQRVGYAGIGGGGTAETARCATFRVGPVEVSDLQAMIADVPSITQQLQMEGVRCGGIVGYSFISQFVCTIDYGASEIRVVQGGSGGGASGGGTDAETGAYFGIVASDLTAEERRDVGSSGVRVVDVVDGSPADEARLHDGDVITAVSGASIESVEALAALLDAALPGATVTVTVTRNHRPRDVEVTLGDRPL